MQSHWARAVAIAFALLVAAPPRPVSAHRAEADVFVNRAIVAYEDGRYEDALQDLGEARTLAPENVDALFYTGLVNAAMGRLEEARRAFEQARTLSPDDEGVRFQLGVVLFHLERDEEAAAILEELFRSRRSLDGLGYYVGVLRHRKGDDQGALDAFRASVSKDPDVQQLTRFYTGLVLVRLGLPESAEAEIEEALHLQPGSPLTGPAERLRDLAASASRRQRRFRAQIRVGGYYDDNVAVKPELSDDPLVQSLRQQEKESPGALTALRADYTFLRRAAFEATATYSFFSTTNTDLPEFDIIDHLGAVGGTWRGTIFSVPAQASLDYGYEYVTLALDEFLQRHSASPYVTLVEDDRNSTSLQGRFQSKDFADDARFAPDDRRDGENWLVGFVHVLRLRGDQLLAKAGYQWDADDTDGRNFQYAGHRALAGVQAVLPFGGVRLSYDFDVHVRDYAHRNTTLPVDAPGTRERSDTEMNHTVWLTRALPKDLTLALVGQHTDSRSNLDPFEYERNVVTLQLIWSY